MIIVAPKPVSGRIGDPPLQQANAAAGRAYAVYDPSVASSDLVPALGLREALVRGHLDDRHSMLDVQSEVG